LFSAIKRIISDCILYAITAAAGFLLLIVCARIGFLNSVIFIYFYRLLYYIIIAHIVLVLLAVLLLRVKAAKRLAKVGAPRFFAALVISMLFSALFVAAGSVAIDRSYTVFIIANMYENADKEFSAAEIESIFIDEYVIKNEATNRRINEQLETGNIEQTPNGGYRITEKGMGLIRMMRFVEALIPADEKWSIYPDYP